MANSSKTISPKRNFTDAGIALFLTTVHFILVHLFIGFHYAWIEDVWMNLLVRGMVTTEPVGGVSIIQQGFSSLWVVLYRIFPNIPWYGITHYAILWCSMSLMLYLLIREARSNTSLNSWGKAASIMMLILYFTEVLIAFSYWDTALLSGIAAIAFFLYDKQNRIWNALILIACLAVALLMRMESIYFLVITFLLFISYQKVTGHASFRLKNLLLVPALLVFVYVAVLSIVKPFTSEKPPFFEQYKKQVVNFYDYGYQRPGFQLNNKQDSLSMLATISFFHAEPKLHREAFFDMLTYKGIIPAIADADWKTRAYNAAVKSEQFSSKYTDYRNYGYKALLVFTWGVMFIFFAYPHGRRLLLAGIFLTSWIPLLLIAIFLKMEHHIHRSLLVMLILPLLLSWVNTNLPRSNQKIALVMMLFLGAALAPRWLQFNKHFDTLDKEKTSIRKVLRALPEDYVFIDNFTSSFLYDTPLKDLQKNFSGKQILFFPEQPTFYANGVLPVNQTSYAGLSPMEQYFKFLRENEDRVACLYVETYRAELFNAIGTEFYEQSPELTKTRASVFVTSLFSDRPIPVNIYKPMPVIGSPSAGDK